MKTVSSFRPVALLAGLTLAGWMACALWPQVLGLLGIGTYGMWFLDSYAVLAASDASHAGITLAPGLANPLDPLLRDHKYSDWWLALQGLGLTRAHNFAVGGAWVAAFAVVAWQTMRPRDYREAAWLAVLLLSPGVLLAVHRANNDLVIFALLAATSLAVRAGPGRLGAALAALVLATGLKFYPVVAALAFLWVRPVGRMPRVLLLALLAAGLAFASVWTQVIRGLFSFEATVHTVGAPLLLNEFGLTGPVATGFSAGLIALAGIGLALGRITAGLSGPGDEAVRMRAALGAIVVVACFVAGLSYAYRWVFLLWPACWLWRRMRDGSVPERQRWAARVGCALVGVCLWLDGGLCVVVNLLPPRDPVWVNHVQLVFRQWTQPLHWLLMILLAGWLLEGALATGREWRSERPVR